LPKQQKTGSQLPPPVASGFTVTERIWQFGPWRECRDTNGDGIVDQEAAGETRLTDGYGTYKADDDFDGFYDREWVAGGLAGETTSSKVIRERVPALGHVPPTRIVRCPRPHPPPMVQ
jgi:hypothetical protein